MNSEDGDNGDTLRTLSRREEGVIENKRTKRRLRWSLSYGGSNNAQGSTTFGRATATAPPLSTPENRTMRYNVVSHIRAPPKSSKLASIESRGSPDTHSPNQQQMYYERSPTVATTNDGSEGETTSCCRYARLSCCCIKGINSSRMQCTFSRWAIATMTQTVQSRLWKCTNVLCSFILLFGQSIQQLASPKSWDVFFTVIDTVVILLLFGDILFNACVDPTYFLWYFKPCRTSSNGCCRRIGSKENTCCFVITDTERGLSPDSGVQCLEPRPIEAHRTSSFCQFGSFMFWLDLLSTLSLMPELPYLNPRVFRVQQVRASTSAYGILKSNHVTGSRENNTFVTNDVMQLIFSLGRTCRLGRFVSAANAVRISETFNVYRWAKCVWRNLSCWMNTVKHHDITKRKTTGEEFRVTSSFDGSRSSSGSTLHRLGLRNLSRKAEHDTKVEAAICIQTAWRVSTGHAVARTPGLAKKKPLIERIFFEGRLSIKSFRRHSYNTITRSSISSTRTSAAGRAKASVNSQVGAAMRELTAQRVVIGIIVAIFISTLFVYNEPDTSAIVTMVTLHGQTNIDAYSTQALNAARLTSTPGMFLYRFSNGSIMEWNLDVVDVDALRDGEKLNVTVVDYTGNKITYALFSRRQEMRADALVGLVATFFILAVWIIGVAGSTGPVMTLVVTPIERMISLLSMLTKDPLGYQSTPRYKRFVDEEYEIAEKTRWTVPVLRGMETSFLMSTILRIGSLMRVGFGSAGVEIIKNNLQKGSDGLVMNLTGSMANCIFLFCDIRQFTDATEALQEEVFVFTNKIAAVVHSICHSYGGSANKNVGDAFLLSWRLNEIREDGRERTESTGSVAKASNSFRLDRLCDQQLSRSDQADRALLSVIKVCIALYNDHFFLNSMTELAKERLKEKTWKRKGPCVQMGFGLHSGIAVQGAIGSQRKIDPSYVSEAVDRSETLEGLTKRYGVKVLMSNAYQELLSPSNRRRCRKIDQLILNEDGNDTGGVHITETGEVMELFTFDMDIDALYDQSRMSAAMSSDRCRIASDIDSSFRGEPVNLKRGRRTSIMRSDMKGRVVRRPSKRLSISIDHDISPSIPMPKSISDSFTDQSRLIQTNFPANISAGESKQYNTGMAVYNPSVWLNEDMRAIRKRYTDGLFYQSFNSGLHSYFNRDWQHAKQCFSSILDRFEDGPSRHFLTIIEENDECPPHGFTGYGSL